MYVLALAVLAAVGGAAHAVDIGVDHGPLHPGGPGQVDISILGKDSVPLEGLSSMVTIHRGGDDIFRMDAPLGIKDGTFTVVARYGGAGTYAMHVDVLDGKDVVRSAVFLLAVDGATPASKVSAGEDAGKIDEARDNRIARQFAKSNPGYVDELVREGGLLVHRMAAGDRALYLAYEGGSLAAKSYTCAGPAGDVEFTSRIKKAIRAGCQMSSDMALEVIRDTKPARAFSEAFPGHSEEVSRSGQSWEYAASDGRRTLEITYTRDGMESKVFTCLDADGHAAAFEAMIPKMIRRDCSGLAPAGFAEYVTGDGLVPGSPPAAVSGMVDSEGAVSGFRAMHPGHSTAYYESPRGGEQRLWCPQGSSSNCVFYTEPAGEPHYKAAIRSSSGTLVVEASADDGVISVSFECENPDTSALVFSQDIGPRILAGCAS
ncbi:MAG: hypothetical protein MPJ02_05650 [Nitrosopumilus sp.]|nr:hypothetical protein [Nitrosopumilus sp.]MDA7999087.1 hypothetical protein [Nitrosopumilus sp.]